MDTTIPTGTACPPLRSVTASPYSDQVILRLSDVERRIGLKKTTIYRLISERRFPKPIPLGARSVGFVLTEVDAWIAARIAERQP